MGIKRDWHGEVVTQLKLSALLDRKNRDEENRERNLISFDPLSAFVNFFFLPTAIINLCCHYESYFH